MPQVVEGTLTGLTGEERKDEVGFGAVKPDLVILWPGKKNDRDSGSESNTSTRSSDFMVVGGTLTVDWNHLKCFY